MKLSGSQISLTLAAAASGAENVVELDESSFNDHVKQHDLVMVEFYAPWCGHCKNLAAEWEGAATIVKDDAKDITFAKIDCDDNPNVCSEYGVRGYPTVSVFEKGETTGTYMGARAAKDIAEFARKRAEDPVLVLTKPDELEAFLAEHAAAKPVVFAYFGPEAGLAAYEAVARENRDILDFVAVPDSPELAEKHGAALVVFRTEDGNTTVRAAPGDAADAAVSAAFVDRNAFPTFGDLGPENYEKYMKAGTPMSYGFVEDAEQRELVKRASSPHIASLDGKANIVFSDASAYPRHASAMNSRAEFPAMMVFDVATNRKFVHSQDIAFDEKSIDAFVRNFLAGKIEPTIKSAPVPEAPEEGGVYTLVGSEYEKIVLDDAKDVLVEFYAPWCGHCKNSKPEYAELGAMFADDADVVIAQLDHTENEVPDEITGYPTIKSFPAGNKGSPVEFEGARTAEELAKFVREHGSKAMKAAKIDEAAKAAKAAKDEDTTDEKKEL